MRMRGGLAVLLLCLCRLSFAQGGGMRYCANCPELVVIPAGQFAMGTAPGEEEREQLAPEFRHRSEA